MSEQITPADWIGERVRMSFGSGKAIEEVYGPLESVTEYGVVINARSRREEGPVYYGWREIRFIVPQDRQEQRPMR